MLFACLLSAGIWIGIFRWKVTSLNSEAMFVSDLYAYKTPLAKQISPRKILLIGGSGTLFSLNAASISRSTGMPVFNYGTHAGVGLRYIVTKSREVLKRGDTAILIPEYELYYDTSVPSETMYAYTLASDRPYLNQISIKDKLTTMFSMSMVDMARGMVKKILTPNKKDVPPGSAYTMEALSKDGDETRNLRSERSEVNTGKVRAFGPQVCLLDSPNEYSESVISEFAAWCKKNGVNLAVTYSSTIDFSEYRTSAYQSTFKKIRDFYKRIDVPVLGEPEDFFFPCDLFLDSPYHGTDILANEASAKLAALIKPVLKN